MNEKRGILMGIAVFVILFAGFAYFNMRDQLSPATKVQAAEAEVEKAESGTENSQQINEEGVLEIKTELDGYGYPAITVEKGVPVKWTILAEEADLTFCNNEITIPALNITKSLVAGENVIEFTPTETGTIPYSCWMGMIRSSITVVEDLEKEGTTPLEIPELTSDVNSKRPAGGSCCGGAVTN